jgi:hypothetical protein
MKAGDVVVNANDIDNASPYSGYGVLIVASVPILIDQRTGGGGQAGLREAGTACVRSRRI